MTTRRLSDTDPLRDAAGVDAVRALCHDLRQPLSAILMLAESGVGDPERRLATIRDEARWLASMIDDVLTDAPVDRPDVVDVLQLLVRGCVDRTVPPPPARITVTGRPGAEAFVPRRWGSAGPSAASSTTPSGRPAPAAASRIDVHEQAGSVHVVVEDDGPGLGKVAAHTSMGLTITAALVSSSGGQFTLTPRSGAPHGAVARIVLPRARRTGGGFMRLVVCDDHRLLVDALTLALTEEGHEVVATPGRPGDAVEAVREHQPDACLLDVSFPDESGLSAIGLIHAASPATKIIILSGSTDQTVVAEAIGKGAHGFVEQGAAGHRDHRRPRARPRRAHGRGLRPAPAGPEARGSPPTTRCGCCGSSLTASGR